MADTPQAAQEELERQIQQQLDYQRELQQQKMQEQKKVRASGQPTGQPPKRSGFMRRAGSGKVGQFVRAATLATAINSQAAGGINTPPPGQAGGAPDQGKSPNTEQVGQPTQSKSMDAAAASNQPFNFYESEAARAADAGNKEEPQTVAPDEEAEKKRELYQEHQKAASTTVQPPPASAQSEEQKAEAGAEDQKGSTVQSEDANAAEESQGGIKGNLAKLRQQNKIAEEQVKKAKESQGQGVLGNEKVQKAAIKAYSGMWTAAHEFLEDAALSLIDLMIVSGPICLLFTFGRLVLYPIRTMYKVKFKGVSVPIMPPFNIADLNRLWKVPLVLFGTGIIWGITVLIIWVLTDPGGAAKALGSEFASAFVKDPLGTLKIVGSAVKSAVGL